MTDWRDHHANEAEKAATHRLAQGAQEEFAYNMGFALDGLPAAGLQKVAAFAAQVARAQALGFDPELLLLTPSEANAHIIDRARRATEAGVPVWALDNDPDA